MRKTLILIALAFGLATTAHAGRRDGDGALLQKKKQPSIVAIVLQALSGNTDAADRDNHLGNR